MILDRYERFSFAVAEISRYWRKLASEELAKCGLKSPHATYLATICKYPQGITVPHLTSTTGMAAPTHAVEAYICRYTTKKTRRIAT